MGLPGAGSLPRWTLQGTGEWGPVEPGPQALGWGEGKGDGRGGGEEGWRGGGGWRGEEGGRERGPGSEGPGAGEAAAEATELPPQVCGLPLPTEEPAPQSLEAEKGEGQRLWGPSEASPGPRAPQALSLSARQGQPRGHPCPPRAHTHRDTHGGRWQPGPTPRTPRTPERLWMSLRRQPRQGVGPLCGY